MSVNTKNLNEDLKKFEDLFHFRILLENHELLSNKNERISGIFRMEISKNVWIDEFVCLRSKMYAFKCGDSCSSKNRLKCFSKSQLKNIKLVEYKKSLDADDYQKECGIYFFRSLNNKMCLQRVLKSTLTPFDDKR